MQLARAYVESIHIPGAEFTFKPLTWVAPPYSMPKDTLGNRAAAKVLEELLGSPPIYYRLASNPKYTQVPISGLPGFVFWR